jgi:hypothetical protein
MVTFFRINVNQIRKDGCASKFRGRYKIGGGREGKHEKRRDEEKLAGRE